MKVVVFAVSILLPLQSPADFVPEDLLAELNEIRVEESVPVLAVTTFRDGKVEFSSVLGDGTVDTPLRWGSITKTFTGLALSKAIRDRDIAWDRPVRELVDDPPWTNTWVETNPVRVQDLAYLCAGMTDLSFSEFNDNTPQTLADRLKVPRKIVWPPGLQHNYTNVTPGISAWLVERLTGEPFHDYIEAHVLAPLGMTKASLDPVPGLPGGFKADGMSEIPYWHMTFTAFGALNASLAEMTKATQRILNSELHPLDMARLRSAGCMAEGEPPLPIGYGAGHYGRVRHGYVWYGHGGDADGYRSRYALLPEHGRGYIVLINTDNPQLLRRLESILERYVVRDLNPPKQDMPDYTTDIQQWAGDYYPSGVRFGVKRWRSGENRRVSIEINGRHLTLRNRDRTTELIPLGDGLFRRTNDPIPTLRFLKREGDVFLQGELGNYFKLDTCPEWFCE